MLRRQEHQPKLAPPRTSGPGGSPAHASGTESSPPFCTHASVADRKAVAASPSQRVSSHRTRCSTTVLVAFFARMASRPRSTAKALRLRTASTRAFFRALELLFRRRRSADRGRLGGRPPRPLPAPRAKLPRAPRPRPRPRLDPPRPVPPAPAAGMSRARCLRPNRPSARLCRKHRRHVR